MKKFLSVILCAIMLLSAVSITAGAEPSYDNQYEHLYYTKYDDHIEITYYEGDTVSVDIPAEIDGLPVTEISYGAFGGCESLTSITIPNGVTRIGEYAFESCYSLTSITIPSSVKSIGYGAFYDTAYYNEESNWQDGVLYIDNCLIGANGELPSDYAINNGTRVIADSVFNGCDSLTNITIPSSVISIGNGAFADCSSLTSVTIPSSVISIGNGAFADCYSLTSVTIPSSVTSIGEGTFYYCESLASITVDNQNQYYCSIDGNLFDKDKKTLIQYAIGKQDSQYTIPDGVINIGYAAFSDCYSLTSVTIPDSVISIGDSAFYWCDSLTSVTIPNSVTSIGDIAFEKCDSLTSVTIPDSVISIGDSAFLWCDSLTSVTIPNSVTSIGDSAFAGCDSLTSATIPNSVISIGRGAFSDCGSLNISVDSGNKNYSDIDGVLFNKDKTEIITYSKDKIQPEYSIPNGVISIGDRAFYLCDSLTSVIIPSSVTSIGDWAFYGTAYYKDKSNWQDGVLYIDNCLIEANRYEISSNYTINSGTRVIANEAFSLCNNLTSVIIPDSVTSIGESAFRSCKSLTGVTIPNSVISIDNGAFEMCGSLTSVTIPDSVTIINDYVFYWCSGLTSVTIPDSVTSIGDGAFNGCGSLTSATIPNSVISIGDSAFMNCESLTDITIPDSVTSIGNGVFEWCKSLTSITVDNQNQYYCSVDGNLFDKDKKTLIQYAIGKQDSLYTIPSGVTRIDNGAFMGCESLKSVTIPSNVTSIGDSAFADCSSLTSVTIPSSVISIDDGAFYICYSLKDIYYTGSEEQWQNIIIGDYNNPLIRANIHYNSAIDTEPTKFAGIPTVSEENGVYMINAELQDIDEDCAMVTVLTNGGKMAGVNTENLTAGQTEAVVTVAADSADEVKIFIWESIDSMKPLCNPQTVNIK